MERRPEINISAIPVGGAGGAGLFVIALSMAAAFPEARWLLIGGLVGGVGLAAALIVVHRP